MSTEDLSPAPTPQSLAAKLSGAGESAVPAERKRRSHQKSRKGCVTCKKRKVKCSEEKPVSLCSISGERDALNRVDMFSMRQARVGVSV